MIVVSPVVGIYDERLILCCYIGVLIMDRRMDRFVE